MGASGCVCMCMDVHGYVWVIMYVRDFMSTVAAHAHSLHANRETLPVSCTGIMRLNHAAILQSWCVHDVYLVVRVCVLDFRFSFSLSVCVCVNVSRFVLLPCLLFGSFLHRRQGVATTTAAYSIVSSPSVTVALTSCWQRAGHPHLPLHTRHTVSTCKFL